MLQKYRKDTSRYWKSASLILSNRSLIPIHLLTNLPPICS